jgi:hypothetical protein
MEGRARDGPEHERAGESGERSAELTRGRRPQVDLQPGQKGQECQAKQGDHSDGLVDLHPGKNGRPDNNPATISTTALGAFTRVTLAARMGAATAITLIISSPFKLTDRTVSGAEALVSP